MTETPLHPVLNPYANQEHRQGCGCRAHMVAIGALSCRACLSWKRRGPVAGECWHPSSDGARKLESETCDRFARKAIHVYQEAP